MESVAKFFVNQFQGGRGGGGTGWYWLILFVMVVGFTFFYTMVQYQQQQIAKNLQRQGAFIPGIRPGAPTEAYLIRVVTRITWAGAFFLGFVAVLPFFVGLADGCARAHHFNHRLPDCRGCRTRHHEATRSPTSHA